MEFMEYYINGWWYPSFGSEIENMAMEAKAIMKCKICGRISLRCPCGICHAKSCWDIKQKEDLEKLKIIGKGFEK